MWIRHGPYALGTGFGTAAMPPTVARQRTAERSTVKLVDSRSERDWAVGGVEPMVRST